MTSTLSMEHVEFMRSQEVACHGREETKVEFIARPCGDEALQKLHLLISCEADYLGSTPIA